MKIIKGCLTIISALSLAWLSSGLLAPAPSSGEAIPFKWHQLETPGSVKEKNDIVSPCEINSLEVCSDNATLYAIDIPWINNKTGEKAIYKSVDRGISWTDKPGRNLFEMMSAAEQMNFRAWNISAAPDDPNLIAVVANNSSSILPSSVWISEDGGTSWVNSMCPITGNISKLAISPKCGKSHDIAIGTRTGIGDGEIWVMNSQHFFNWSNQGLSGDIMELKFSPDYASDNTLVVVFSNTSGTYITAGTRDIYANSSCWNAIYEEGPIEITLIGAGHSPKASQIISASLALPDSFSSKSSTTRKYFISLDCPATYAGIYRFDDTAGCQLMIATPDKRISSIAYHGSLTSGKLLAGEVLGNPCSATVMTWFTDTPLVCTIPCWHASLKPPTGAAGTDNCTLMGYGNALVKWSVDGSTAYVATASTGDLVPGKDWTTPYLCGRPLDESSFSKSINNGKTWAQLSLIDTSINSLIDIAPVPDCSKLYLASINENPGCCGHDSVWLASDLLLGSAWERILCSMTTDKNCCSPQSDIAILRTAGDKPDGQCILWAAQNTCTVKWSDNYGDTWNDVPFHAPMQDAAFESSKNLYILCPNGQVYKLVYRLSAWAIVSNTYCGIDNAYSIATAYTGMTPDNDEGTIIIGSTGNSIWDVAYSTDAGKSYQQVPKALPVRDNTMVIASSSFNNDGYIVAVNSGGMFAYSIYTTGNKPWEEWWGGPSWPDPVTGISISRNYSFYFCTSSMWGSYAYVRWSSANSGFDNGIYLGAASTPSTRLRTCGGLMLDDPTITYIIDQRQFSPPAGGVWYYIDDLLWSGPRPTSPINHFTVTCDPVTGRAGAVELTWLPRSLSRGYDIHIAKDIDFYMPVAKIGDDYFGPYYVPHDPDHPSLYIPPGGGSVVDANGNSWTIPPLEAGHSYYWKVKVQSVATGDSIKSPWSWRESYDVMPGFKVGGLYPGMQLLNPSNGCLQCPLKPAFSWSPLQGASKYEFVLCSDPELQKVIIHDVTTTSSYECTFPLLEAAGYYWRIRALDNTGQPCSDWSATFCFSTLAAKTPEDKTSLVQSMPSWACMVLGISMILISCILFLITRRRAIF